MSFFFFKKKASLSFFKASSEHRSKKIMGYIARQGDSMNVERAEINVICMSQRLYHLNYSS